MSPKLPTFILLASGLSMYGTSLDDVLGKMDSAAPSFRTMTANLRRVTYTKVLDEKSTESGSMSLRKAGRELQIYIDFTQPDPKTVTFRGRKVEMFLPKLKTVQEYDLGKQGALVDQFLFVGFGTQGKELKANYSIKFAGEETIAGQKTWHLHLTPLAAAVKEKLNRLDLWIDENGTHPVQQQFIQPSGDYYLVTYTDVKLNPPLTEDSLKLKVPKGTKRESIHK